MDIIGGGPAGLFSAYNLAKNGVEATVHEEHRQIGLPNHCAGLISKRLTKIIPRGDYIIEKVNGAKIFSSNESFELKRKNVAYVVDRPALDRFLAEMAESEGAKIILSKRAKFEDFKSVIDASGPGSRLRASMGQKLRVLPAPQYVIDEPIETVEVHFTEFAKEFFAWAIPAGDKTRVGMAAKRPELDAFLKKRFGSPKILQKSAGSVIVGGPVKKTVFGSRILVGDAAGQVKATTGGGVIMSLLCAKCAADAIAEGEIASYEERWRKTVGGELKTALNVRRILDRVDMNQFVKLCAQNSKLLEEKGDMDFHGKVVSAFIKKPSNWVGLLRLMASAV